MTTVFNDYASNSVCPPEKGSYQKKMLLKYVLSLLLIYTYETSTLKGPFFCTKTKKYILKKINSVKGSVSGRFFHTIRPINVESHMYKVTN